MAGDLKVASKGLDSTGKRTQGVFWVGPGCGSCFSCFKETPQESVQLSLSIAPIPLGPGHGTTPVPLGPKLDPPERSRGSGARARERFAGSGGGEGSGAEAPGDGRQGAEGDAEGQRIPQADQGKAFGLESFVLFRLDSLFVCHVLSVFDF